MPLIWRAMRIDGDKPTVGRGATLLGVRVGPGEHDDINPDSDGYVSPGTGGMSVSPSVDTVPSHRLPRRLRQKYPSRFPRARAPNSHYCWYMGEGEFGDGAITDELRLRLDPDLPDRHGFVEPSRRMLLATYEDALVATRDQWHKWEE